MGGFDIIIGNPPYVSNKNIDDLEKMIYDHLFDDTDDLYNYFFHRSFEILKKWGVLGYITSDTYMTIGSKKDLRSFLQSKKIIELRLHGSGVFKGVAISTNTIIAQNINEKEYKMKVVDTKNNDEEYVCSINSFKNAPNNVFFVPTEINKQMQEKYGEKIKQIKKEWWSKIETSKKIEKNKVKLKEYRDSLKDGDVTLIGLITDGGQGLATANNGKFVGTIECCKYSQRTLKKRPKKLWNFIVSKKNIIPNELNSLKTIDDVKSYLSKKTEHQIRDLFDGLKEKYGRDIFGQGFLFRIVSENEIADIDSLTDDEKQNGIDPTKPHYVPYDKGDRDGNKWYLENPYYLDWSKENAKWLDDHSGIRKKGMPVVRNKQFYFKEGFCWSDICGDTIKARLKPKSIHDVKSMSLFPFQIPSWYIVSILNSKLISEYKYTFLNNTVSFQINDARRIPIIVPSEDQKLSLKSIFDEAVDIKKKQFSSEITEEEAEELLNSIQDRLDIEVNKIYNVDV